ncbi:hypothetical protein [Bradyrhizobium sp. CB1650]|uniref:hypothetical protein n=1 Tax=Bradyrhizobium sp. CB1650 TaxID=3039153 RepID=UPI00325FABBB
MRLDFVGHEIERMRTEVHRQRGDIRQLQRAGIPTASAEALLGRMLNISTNCAQSAIGSRESSRPSRAGVGGHGDRASPILRRHGRPFAVDKALAEVRIRAPREGWCYQHVQAIIVAIDQYAEAALGNRQFFLNRPYGIDGGAKDRAP